MNTDTGTQTGNGQQVNTQTPATGQQGDQGNNNTGGAGGDKGQGQDFGDLQSRYLTAIAKYEAQALQLKQQLDSERKSREDSETRLKNLEKDPYAALEQLGGSLDGLTQRVMNNGKPTADELVDGLNKKIASLEEKLASREKTEKQQAEEAKKDAYFSDFAGDVSKMFDADDYKEVKLALELEKQLFGAEPNIIKTVRHIYESNKDPLTNAGPTPAQVAATILKSSQGLIESIKKSPTLKGILGIQAEQSDVDTSQNQPGSNAQMRNITNNMEGGSTTQPDLARLSNRQAAEIMARKLAQGKQ